MKLHRLRKVSTFEESIEASKLISKAIYEGILDDFGSVAEIEPLEMVLDDDNGQTVGVHFLIRAPASAWEHVIEGVMKSAGFTRELTLPGSNVSVLRPLSESWVRDEFVEQKYSIGAC